MSFLYMIVVVSVAFMFSFYAIQLMRELVARKEEEEIIQFEKQTHQDAYELDLILTYMELVQWNVERVIELKEEDIIIYDQPPVRYYHGRTHQPGNPRSSGHVHLQEPGLGSQ